MTEEGQKHVESNLHAINKYEAMLGGDEFEIDCMNKGPDLPGSLTSSQQVRLYFISNNRKRVTIDKSKISEEHRHEDRTPKDLVNQDFACHSPCICPWNL